MLTAFLTIFVSLLITGYAYPENCNGGSKYWCRNVDTAVECGVLEFCKLNNPELQVNDKTKIENKTVTAPPIKIELYYESLCPGCRALILKQLFPTYEKLQSSGILEIGLYPYGNANEINKDGKWYFTCQHGIVECEVNLLEACALHMLRHPTQFMPFIHCIESNPSLANAKICADKLKLEWQPLSRCYKGEEGNHLQHELAVKTDALNPPHKYVPWVVANGVHTEAIQESVMSDLMHFVCETYTGVKPDACKSHELVISKCYKD